ncbi:MAG: hypothetical protein KC736_01820 [Candidatus Moranbacteria bacterium]|nr:hypothetical protein [Candidatus Moranbacteria bacterium]
MDIISFSGIDGSGKTTQANLLCGYLKHSGKKVFRFHATQFSIAQKISFKKNSSDNTPPAPAVTKASFLAILARIVALSVDIVRFSFLKSKLARQGYDIIVSDRYFYDTIVNILFLRHASKGLCFFDSLIPRTTVSFYLKIDPTIPTLRDRSPEQGDDYLRRKKVIIEENIDRFSFVSIVADRDQSVIAQEINTIVSEHLLSSSPL